MELKSIDVTKHLVKLELFKSHLYGIEIWYQ